MNLLSYGSYTNSNILWVGSYPSHWDITKIKYEAYVKARVGWHGLKSDDFTDEGPYLVTGSDFKSTSIRWQDCYHCDLKRYEQDPYIQLGNGDLLITKDGTIGKVALVQGLGTTDKATLNSGVFVVRPLRNNLSTKFYYWLLQSKVFTDFVDFNKTGSTIVHLYQDTFVNFSYASPQVCDQIQISSFLDYETKKIDNLIEKQKQLIELLKEKRQAVISHAITKGLNPDVPMKVSGIEWLGKIPEHWSIKRLKHISPKVGVGLVINPSTYTREEGVYFIFGGDVKEYGFDLSKTRKISPKDSNNLLPSRLTDQDLVSVRVGYPGITAVVTKDLEGSNCASIIIIRKGLFNSEWLCAAMNVWVGRQQVDLVAYGAAQKQFNVADAVEFIFPVPSYDEQVKIADFVKKSLDKFDALSSKAQAQINLLQERRTALIFAAVTGKIDVRNWVAPEAEKAEVSQETTA
ncbi:restriction endonuclease subunit S [Serratia quinivorans]|uniref:restriction endonuclease subunit S n=1 Tax=Serratia quinivorans TaxID=137545 RepID=UPI003982B41F